MSRDSHFAFPNDGSGCGMTLREYYMAHAPVTLSEAFLLCNYIPSQSLIDDAIRAGAIQALAQLRAEYADAMMERS